MIDQEHVLNTFSDMRLSESDFAEIALLALDQAGLSIQEQRDVFALTADYLEPEARSRAAIVLEKARRR